MGEWQRRGSAAERGPDWRLLRLVQRLHGRCDAPMLTLTHAGSEVSMTAVMASSCAWLLHRKRRREAAFMLVAGGGALLLGRTLRVLFRRERPAGVTYRCARPATYSFPSGHAMGSAGVLLAGIEVLHALDASRGVRRGAALFTSVFAPGVAASRVYCGVHFPSDVVGGALCAWLWVRCIARCIPIAGALHHGARLVDETLAHAATRRAPALPPAVGHAGRSALAITENRRTLLEAD